MPLHYLCSELSKSNRARGSPLHVEVKGTALPILTFSCRGLPDAKSEEPYILATLQNASSGPGAKCDEPFILPHPELPSRGLPGTPQRREL